MLNINNLKTSVLDKLELPLKARITSNLSKKLAFKLCMFMWIRPAIVGTGDPRNQAAPNVRLPQTHHFCASSVMSKLLTPSLLLACCHTSGGSKCTTVDVPWWGGRLRMLTNRNVNK